MTEKEAEAALFALGSDLDWDKWNDQHSAVGVAGPEGSHTLYKVRRREFKKDTPFVVDWSTTGPNGRDWRSAYVKGTKRQRQWSEIEAAKQACEIHRATGKWL